MKEFKQGGIVKGIVDDNVPCIIEPATSYVTAKQHAELIEWLRTRERGEWKTENFEPRSISIDLGSDEGDFSTKITMEDGRIVKIDKL